MNQEVTALLLLSLYYIVSTYYEDLSNTKALRSRSQRGGDSTKGKPVGSDSAKGKPAGGVDFNLIRFAIDNAKGLVAYAVMKSIETMDDILPEDWENMSGANFEEVAPRLKNALAAAETLMKDPEVRKELGQILATSFETVAEVMEQPSTRAAMNDVLQATSENVEKFVNTVARTGTEASMEAAETVAGLVPFLGSGIDAIEVAGTLLNGATSVAESVIAPSAQAVASGAQIVRKATAETEEAQEKVMSAIDGIKDRFEDILSKQSGGRGKRRRRHDRTVKRLRSRIGCFLRGTRSCRK